LTSLNFYTSNFRLDFCFNFHLF